MRPRSAKKHLAGIAVDRPWMGLQISLINFALGEKKIISLLSYLLLSSCFGFCLKHPASPKVLFL